MLTMISLSMRIVLVLAALARPASGFFPGKSFAVSGGVAQQIEMGLASIQNLKQQSASRRHKGGSSATRTAPRMSTSSSLETSTTSDNYELLRGVKVQRASSGEELDLLKTWTPLPGKKTIVAFFTHTADFNSWEYAQKLRHYLPQIDDAGVGLVGVSLGTVDAARDFCAETGFPLDSMYMFHRPDGTISPTVAYISFPCPWRMFATIDPYAKMLAMYREISDSQDPTGQAYSALGFSNGFEPRLPGDKKINPYLRLLPMLAGIGSPGTIQAVLKGYIGDPNANADWISSALTMVDNTEFDFLGKQGSRPLELATLRLQNMQQIVTKWNKLAPPDKELITQQGGTMVFEGRENVYSFKDKGILVYTDVIDMLETIGVEI